MFDNFCESAEAIGCGFWAFLYLYQTAVGGALALLAGIAAYLAGRTQATAARTAASQTIEAMRDTTAQTIAHEQKLAADAATDASTARERTARANLVHLFLELNTIAAAIRFGLEDLVGFANGESPNTFRVVNVAFSALQTRAEDGRKFIWIANREMKGLSEDANSLLTLQLINLRRVCEIVEAVTRLVEGRTFPDVAPDIGPALNEAMGLLHNIEQAEPQLPAGSSVSL